MKNRNLIILFAFPALLFLNACEKNENSDSDHTNSTDGISHEEIGDYLWDAESATEIVYNGNNVTSSSSSVSISGSIATITSGGYYTVSGNTTSGQLIVNAGETDIVHISLNNASITCSNAPAVLIEKSLKTILNLPAGTSSSIVDGSNYSQPTDEPNAALFSKSDLTIYGEGALNVKGNFADGLSSKDGLIIHSGQITVTAVDDGIRGKDYLIIQNGNMGVTCNGDGLKSDNDNGSEVGYVIAEAGTFHISAGGDGISALTTLTINGGSFELKTGGGSSGQISADASAKGIKGLASVKIAAGDFIINSADDAIHSNKSIEIASGNFEISTADDGIHADESILINSGTVNITKSVEGIESHIVTINDGNISVVSTDDSFNATAGSRTEQNDNSQLVINGGHIVLNASAGDPLDSNGSITMTNGTVIVHGPNSQPEVAIDYNGSFNISGGLLLASGPSTNMFQAPGTSSSQNSLKIAFGSAQQASTIFHVSDAAGNVVCTFKPLRKYITMVVSSPVLVKGTTYSIYKGGTYAGNDDNGMLSGGSYTPGTLVNTFTITSTVTSLNKL